MCDWVRRVSYDSKSGVKLDGMQKLTSVCNQVDPDPASRWLEEDLSTCADLRRYCSQHGGGNWQFFETSLDIKPPCPEVAFITVMRQPWLRMESTQGKLGWLFPNASKAIRRLKPGDDVQKAKGWNYCPVMHSPTCNGLFMAGYFNNWHIRFLLSSREGRMIPWEEVTEEHLERAKKILEDFDLVVPIDYLADALPAMQCAVGSRYDIGIDGSASGRYGFPKDRRRADMERASCSTKGKPLGDQHDAERHELCKLFNEHNKLDIQLYDWVVTRWQNWEAGRCRQP